ncbi:MAG: bis(5'-nucleosyl)-tetraphosphatase (symmetrical) YqeK [Clostridia bacterium]|nr:bis(5'-nucleosyl)-tetraphosphatase (symmetrical) YqeK [Clostridia bacterium]
MTDANSILSAMTISEKRLKHTLGVAEAAKELAKTHFPALDLKQVELAALMHDFTKEYPHEKQLELCAHYNLQLTEDEKNNPKLLHSKTGAMIASERFGLPSEACSAIYWHTTGKAEMSPFEIVIYLADYIEEFRDDAGCIKLREFYKKAITKELDKTTALHKTLVRSFDTTIKHLISQEQTICNFTVEARNYYINRLNEIKF